ncbi:hypothetical protein GYMLUDRAFT_918846 [Collybiopsis luxurians FD-317 M1]|uniref:Unplaced genomic scaffold GYMLUscaffold_71, whole genome shotgun sequence n=1 Tax=Collybiopsis luxurians FD-317 M1 TaxID=944289 RepID=A0A0D0C8C0_9AGAR|nr:hypothetical protein GYMLUDRAFT_918846 [Collybiopsis luxurians FD-317 M1]
MTAISQSNGFPPGYFVIKSVATGRVLDVGGDQIEDGTEIILWPEKEKSLVESRRNPEANNQVFFIDTSGALCSRSAGHAVDIDSFGLVLRHRRPISLPFPNHYAHPLPKFSYSPATGEISVNFECDPSYPPPNVSASSDWKNNVYILTSVPLRKPKTFIDDASEFITTKFTTPLASFFGAANTHNATPEQVESIGVDLAEEDVLEEDRGEEAEVDDSPDEKREVRMLTISPEHPRNLVERAKLRRQWEIIPLRTANKRTTGVMI